jgi:hypothetical protein
MSETVPNLQTSVPWGDLKKSALHGVVRRYGVAVVAFALALALKSLLGWFLLLRGEASYFFSCRRF